MEDLVKALVSMCKDYWENDGEEISTMKTSDFVIAVQNELNRGVTNEERNILRKICTELCKHKHLQRSKSYKEPAYDRNGDQVWEFTVTDVICKDCGHAYKERK